MTTPFGGHKRSGFGGLDKSVQAHDWFVECAGLDCVAHREREIPAVDAQNKEY